jgi:glycosyltransferase involved in cell wall biosynthesis
LGYVPAEDLARLYKLASEIAYVGFGEGFGLPVLEAMASGTVVVASDVPAVEDSDPEAVVRVDPESVESIAQGLLDARQDEATRQRWVERGRAAASRFTWEQAAASTWRIYREACGLCRDA